MHRVSLILTQSYKCLKPYFLRKPSLVVAILLHCSNILRSTINQSK